MPRPSLTAATEEVTRIVGAAPPLMPELLQGGTRITGQWDNPPIDVYLQPPREHIISASYGGTGFASALIDGRRLRNPIRPATITIAPRGHDGHWHVSGPRRVSNVFLGHDRLARCADEMAEGRAFELMDRVLEPDERLFWVMRLLAAEVARPGPHALLFLEETLDLVCLHLLRGHSTLAVRSRDARPRLSAEQIQRVTRYMRDHLATAISLQDLANLLSMSRFHFCASFRREIGTTPYAFLVQLRMELARKLLTATPLSVAEIGLSVGYVSAAAFSTAFHRVTGVSPTAYRSRC